MESLGDMLKQWPKGREMTQRAEEKLEELLQDPLVEKLMEKYSELDKEMVKLNLNVVYQYAKEHRSCVQCPGLDNCPNDFQGHYTMVSVSGESGTAQLIDRKVTCRKFIARRNEEQIRSRIRSFYVSEKTLARAYSADEILTMDLERAPAVMKLLRYIERAKEEGLQSDGLYLAGRFGTGKTFLMGYLLGEMAKLGYSCVIVYMPDFVEDLKSMLGEAGKLKETVDMMKETDLLVFDDIGAENLNPWVRLNYADGIRRPPVRNRDPGPPGRRPGTGS